MIVNSQWPAPWYWPVMVFWAVLMPVIGYLVMRRLRSEIRDVL
jgi:ABC-type polysaccharide/polyol phosphate export permease